MLTLAAVCADTGPAPSAQPSRSAPRACIRTLHERTDAGDEYKGEVLKKSIPFQIEVTGDSVFSVVVYSHLSQGSDNQNVEVVFMIWEG